MIKKREGFVLRRVAGEAVIVGESLELIDFDSLVSLNDSAAYVWEALGENNLFDGETVADLLTEKYNINREVALADACELLNQWLEAEICVNQK